MKTNDSGQGNRKRVGAEIRKVREAKGMTRKELAAILGGDCTENTVKRYEDGDIIMDVDVLFAVTAALGVTPNDIAPGEVMAGAASGLGDYARLSGKNKRMVDQMIGIVLRDQRADGIG